MPGDVYIGGGVYVNIPPITDTYWPVAGVAKPQHLWPFIQTGDGTDQGSTGGLDLSVMGSGGSFSENGWENVATSYLQRAAGSSDLDDLGSTFSLLIEFVYSSQVDFIQCLGGKWDWSFSKAEYLFAYIPANTMDAKCYISDAGNDAHQLGTTYTMSSTTQYQFIATLDGSGNGTYYVNGSPTGAATTSLPTPKGDSDSPFLIGRNDTDIFIGTIVRAGVLKGTAWSADDVAAIYTAFS